MTTQIKGNDTSTFGGNIDVIGNVVTDAPSFYAYGSVVTSANNATWTKLIANTELWDTDNCYDTSNYRFTPNVEGYYLLSAIFYMGNTTNGRVSRIMKNGVTEVLRGMIGVASVGIGSASSLNGLVYANGTTDYFEYYIYQTSGSTIDTVSAAYLTYFSGHLARAV